MTQNCIVPFWVKIATRVISLFRFPTLLAPNPVFRISGYPSLHIYLNSIFAMKRTASQAFNEPRPTLLVETSIKLDLYVALNPIQFQALMDHKAILPDPYSQRFGLRSDPIKATERAHYFMNWPTPTSSDNEIKKYMICLISFTPVGFLNLTDKGVLEHGDGWNHSRPGYYRFNGPLFHSQHGRGTDGVEYELYSFSNEYTELVWGE